MQRHAVDLAGDQAGQAARGRRRDELRVADVELGRLQHRAAHPPVEAADAAAGRRQPLALEVGRGLDLARHHVGLRHARREAPDLLHLQAAADRDVADADDGGALRRRDRRGLRLAALELHDVGVDAALLEIAQRLGHVGRGVHHVGRRHRHADVDLAHRRAVAAGRRRVPVRRCKHGGGQRERDRRNFVGIPGFLRSFAGSIERRGCPAQESRLARMPIGRKPACLDMATLQQSDCSARHGHVHSRHHQLDGLGRQRMRDVVQG